MPVKQKQKESIKIKDPKALSLLIHPVRMKLMTHVLYNAKTAKELAKMVQFDPPAIYYHLKLLLKHGIIFVSEENIVSGIIEKKYLATAKRFNLSKTLLESKDMTFLSEYETMLMNLSQEAGELLQKAILDGIITKEGPTNSAIWLKPYHLTKKQIKSFQGDMIKIVDGLERANCPGKSGSKKHYYFHALFPIE